MIGVTFKGRHELERVKDWRREARKRLVAAVRAGLSGATIEGHRRNFRYYDSLLKELRAQRGRRP